MTTTGVDADAPTPRQRSLTEMLDRLETISLRGDYADDHVINVLLERYAQYREKHARITA